MEDLIFTVNSAVINYIKTPLAVVAAVSLILISVTVVMVIRELRKD